MMISWWWTALIMSSGLGTGFLPKILPGFRPGGGGGLMGRLVALFAIQFPFLYYGWGVGLMLSIIAIISIIAFLTIRPAESFYLLRWGTALRHTGEISFYDFNHTNIDEIIGQLVAGLPVFLFPGSTWWMDVAALLVSCAIFQYLDDKKPLGIKKFEKDLTELDRTTAIIFDDILAGVYAAVLCFVFIKVGNPTIQMLS